MSLFGIKVPRLQFPSLRSTLTAGAVGMLGPELVASATGGHGIFSPPSNPGGMGFVQGLAYRANASARASALANVTKGNYDEITKSEVLTAYQSGASGGSLAQTLRAAAEGKGIYAIRRINENQQKALKAAPGRSQLTAGYGMF